MGLDRLALPTLDWFRKEDLVNEREFGMMIVLWVGTKA